jgi:NADPH:quinone reductase
MRAIVFTGAGGAEVVGVEERPDPEPGDQEILVAVAYAGLNPADLAQRAGRYPPPPGSPQDVPGLEVAGRVVACGSKVRDWHAGERVFGCVCVHERHVVAVPERLGEEEAAAVPEAFITAHDAIFTRGELRSGETLLVDGANGGVGTAGVQLGVAAGAQVVARVRSEQTAGRLEELGAEVLVGDGAPGVPVDVVLELVGAPLLGAAVDALAPLGRIVVVGAGAGSRLDLNLSRLMRSRGSIAATQLRARPLEQKAAAVQAFGRHVVPLLARGAVRPLIDRVFPAEEAVAAFDHLAGSGKLGKVLLRFDGA